MVSATLEAMLRAHYRSQPRYTIAQIRERHHELAKRVAAGEDSETIHAAMDFGASGVEYVEMMRSSDPCFMALVHHYKTGEPMFTVPKRR